MLENATEQSEDGICKTQNYPAKSPIQDRIYTGDKRLGTDLKFEQTEATEMKGRESPYKIWREKIMKTWKASCCIVFSVYQGLAKFSCKGPRSQIFSSAAHIISVMNSPAFVCLLKTLQKCKNHTWFREVQTKIGPGPAVTPPRYSLLSPQLWSNENNRRGSSVFRKAIWASKNVGKQVMWRKASNKICWG